MTQFIPQQKTLPERMASIETLLYGFIGDFRRYQEAQDENFKLLKESLSELKTTVNDHLCAEDRKVGKTWSKVKWEVLRYIIVFLVAAIAGALWEFYTK